MGPQLPLQQSSPAAIPLFTGPVAPRASRMPRLVAIGGGTGLPVVLAALRHALPTAHGLAPSDVDIDRLTAIVTVTDDGGSSGWVRRELGTLPPGDIRNCLAALAGDSALAQLLQHRFNDSRERSGHSIGNLMLAGLAQITGSFADAVDQLGRALSSAGRVLPSTAESIALRAEFVSGSIVEGESAIAQQGQPIRRLSLERPVRPLPEALRALINADAVIVGPGSLYTSVLPNLLVDGVAATLSGIDAVRILVANLMTEPGETDGFSVDDHLRVLREHVGLDLFDYILVNVRGLTGRRGAEQARHGSVLVTFDGRARHAGSAVVVFADLLAELPTGEVRHDPARLGAALLRLVRRGRRRGVAKLA